MTLAVFDIPGLVKTIIDQIGNHIPLPQDKQKMAELEATVTTAVADKLASVDIAQTQVNIEETKKEGWFYSGWRPAIGWMCFGALFQHYIIFPWFEAFLKSFKPPVLDWESLLTILLGMLGLSTQRMLEKRWGVNNKR